MDNILSMLSMHVQSDTYMYKHFHLEIIAVLT